MPNHGKLYAARGHAYVVVHVLRISSDIRDELERREEARVRPTLPAFLPPIA